MKIPYGRQDIQPADIEAVVRVLRSDFLTQGDQIPLFEEIFCRFLGGDHAVAVANGTAALHLACMALGVGEGVRVITTPITFAASANCVRYCGGEVYFCDIDPDTALMSLENLENLLQSKPKGFFAGLIVVDFAGLPCDMVAFRKLADEHGLWIIEDACHALGGYFFDQYKIKHFCGNGKWADISVFSFHPVKHIACGEGGMITTNKQTIYKKLQLLRTHGITKNQDLLQENHGTWYYEMQELGYNYRLTDIQAALGISQMQRIQANLVRRRQIASVYKQELVDLPIKILQGSNEKISHAYHLFVIKTKKRKELFDYLHGHGIFAQVHYIPVHLMPYYKDLGFKKGSFPQAEAYYEECISIPMYHSLKEEEQQYVIDKIKAFFS